MWCSTNDELILHKQKRPPMGWASVSLGLRFRYVATTITSAETPAQICRLVRFVVLHDEESHVRMVCMDFLVEMTS